jgi:biopolymer transport protein ExbB/TolQ
MATLTLGFFFIISVYSAVVVLGRLADLNASKFDTASLRPELNVAIISGDVNQALALCERRQNSVLGRVMKEAAARMNSVRGSHAARTEMFRLLLDEAQAREAARADRTTGRLLTIASICAPIGLMATAWDASSAMDYLADYEGISPLWHRLSDAFPYAIAGMILSIAAFGCYKYLDARFRAELASIRDCTSDLFCAFLSVKP